MMNCEHMLHSSYFANEFKHCANFGMDEILSCFASGYGFLLKICQPTDAYLLIRRRNKWDFKRFKIEVSRE